MKKVHDLIQIFNAMLWIRNDLLFRIRIREGCSKKFKNIVRKHVINAINIELHNSSIILFSVVDPGSGRIGIILPDPDEHPGPADPDLYQFQLIVKKTIQHSFQGFGSGSGSGWIRIILSCWIRIRIETADPDPDPGGKK
jgi:hypothetical protein